MKASMVCSGFVLTAGMAAVVACTSPWAKDAYRVKADGGVTVQCQNREDAECGLTLKDCNNKHEYHCLHGVDLELVAADAPLPAPPAPAPAPAPPPPAQAPAPAPQK